ncbi:hypothetical protein GGI43DRAFT_115544 [Trichoderma evansii]
MCACSARFLLLFSSFSPTHFLLPYKFPLLHTFFRPFTTLFSITILRLVNPFPSLLHLAPFRRRYRPNLRDRDHKRASSSYRSTLHPGIRSALGLHQPCSTCYYPPPVHPLFDAFIFSARRANTVFFSQWLSTAASGVVFLFFCRTAVGFVAAVLLSCPLTW